MKTFREFCKEAYDADLMRSSTIRKGGEGGRIGRERRQDPQQTRRVKAVGGGKTEPVVQKPRKDIGKDRPKAKVTARQEQPQQERGSADVKAKAAAAAKEERRKAALARRAAKSGGESKPAAKTSSKSAEKKATELLRKDAASKKTQKSSEPKRSYTKHDYSDAEKKVGGKLTSKEKTKIRSAKQNKTKREIYNAKKSEAWAKHERVFGTPPKGKKKTRMIGKLQKKHPPR